MAQLDHPIRTARLRARLSQKRLADKLGVTKATVSGWECGHYRPGIDAALRLTQVLRGLTVQAIYAKTNEVA